MKNQLAKKHVIYVLACSSFFAVIISVIQLYTEFKKDVEDIRKDIEIISKSYMPALVSGCYNFDNNQVDLLLTGLTGIRNIVYAEIIAPKGNASQPMNRAGDPSARRDISMRYPLVHDKEAKELYLGELFIYSNLDYVKSRLSGRILVLILTNAVKTIFMSFCILWIVQVLTIRPLNSIAAFTQNLNLETIGRKARVSIRSKAIRQEDELDQIADAINSMIIRIKADVDLIHEAKRTQADLNFKLEQTNRDLKDEMERRKIIEARLYQAQKMEAIGTLAGGIAHDMNNILYPIIGLSELLFESMAPHRLEYDHVKGILSAALRARDLVKQILAFSRQSEPQNVPVKLSFVINEVITLMRKTIPPGITITRDIRDDCFRVMADPSRLHQVFMNLMTNAYQSIGNDEGHIKVTVSCQEPFLPDDHDPPLARITVSDNGCGIPESVKENIFDPYFTTKDVGKGTGLGLSVVYGIVKKYNGDIYVESSENHGTSITVLLPVIDTVDEAPKDKTNDTLKYGTEHLLVVDDEPSVGKLEKTILEKLGYRVTLLNNPMEAITHIKGNPETFDLVITDLSMPGLTGDKLARELTAIRPGLPVIICSGYGDKVLDSPDTLPEGISGFLMKPVETALLAKMVRDLLDKQSQH